MKEKLLFERPEEFRVFPWNDTTDPAIKILGYHDFRHVKPIVRPRRQDFHTLHFVISGKGTLIVNGTRYEVGKNQVFYVDDETLFSYYPDEKDPWQYIFIEFRGKSAVNYVRSAGFSSSSPITTSGEPYKFLELAVNCFNREQTTYAMAISVFWLLVASVTLPTGGGRNRQDETIERLKACIKMRFLDPDFSVESLCREQYISHSHLCRVFKAYEQITVAAYVRRLRLDYAASLLVSSDYSLKNVAFMSGFKEYEYFFRSFRNQFGMTPTAYRQNYLQATSRKNESDSTAE